MANFTVPAGKTAAASDFTLKDKTGRTHAAKRHVFHDASGNQAVAVHVAVAANATPAALAWKSDFEDLSKPNRRHVINLVFKDANGKAVTVFDPPVELRVTLTLAEQARASVKLVYYDPTARQWKSFGDATRDGAEIVASISSWFSDPGIGAD